MTELSPRQREWLRFTAAGMSAKQIAFELGISKRTVEALSIMTQDRLNAGSAAHAVAIGMREGIIS